MSQTPGPRKTNEERFYRHWEINGLADRPDLIAKLWEVQKAKEAAKETENAVTVG